MKRLYILFIVLSVGFIVLAQEPYLTRTFNSNIKTLQIQVDNSMFSLPVLELNGSDVLTVSFDELSHDAHMYSYKLLHCNADWTLSNLTVNEYLTGFTYADITDLELSQNTTMLYTHYRFTLPNDDLNFKISGNYVILIYEDNQPDKPIAQACFSVVDPRIKISGNIRGNTDTELNKRMQQLDFELTFDGYTVREPTNEIKVTVKQNNRTDNQVTNLQPTYVATSKLSYINNRALIFEGGAEYHRFDISSIYAASFGVDTTRYNRPYYDVYLTPQTIQTSRIYINEPDVNGKYVINYQEAHDNVDTEADYLRVFFTLKADQPFFDGQLYIGGEFNHNLLDGNSRMKYDVNAGQYFLSALLKQGGYNFQYWFVPKGQQKASTERVEGSFWQTSNEYTVYVYHRPFGERYDHLVGVKVIQQK